MSVSKFLKDLKEQCKKYNVKLTFYDSESVPLGNGARSTGYFDYDVLEIAVGRKNKDWLSILVHESCHLDQWIEQTDIWTKTVVNDDDVQVDKWLSGKDVRYVKRKLDRTREMELDCERRSLKKIKKYKLPINTKEYIQKANGYVHFYNYLYETRRWTKPENTPYSNKAIYSQMPSYFRESSYYKTLPNKVRNIFIKEKI